MKTIGYAAHSAKAHLEPFQFERRALRPNDVAIEILYSGICHTDVHQAHNDWGFSHYPLVPGHEIIGQVTAVGADVKKYQVGDKVAVGCMVDSCQACDQCQHGEEQFCREGMTQTYCSPDRITGEMTYGGYSKHIVVREEFVLSVPASLDLSRAAPILCAGVTTFSPLRHYNVGPDRRVGVVGLGGLGHMAVKLAKAMGATVTVLTHSANKVAAAKDLGADHVVVMSEQEAVNKAQNSLDFIIDTIPVKHDINPYISLLDIKGTLVVVGQVGLLEEPNFMPMVLGNRRVAGSVIGGIAQTQEVLDFCAKHNIHPECEMIAMAEINEAFSRLQKSDVPHRLVIDMATLELA